MKRTLLFLAVICNCILLSSCTDYGHKRDMTLAGSVSSGRYYLTAIGEYDNTSLGEYKPDKYSDGMNLRKLSDVDVSMDCYTEWEGSETILIISIPRLPLEGEPDNVTFDYTSVDARVTYDNTEYTPVNTSIKGWIRNKDFKPRTTRNEPAVVRRTYLLEIEINCELDGKPLHLLLTSPELSKL